MEFDYIWIGALFVLFAYFYPKYMYGSKNNDFKEGYSTGMGIAGMLIFAIRFSDWIVQHFHINFSWN